MKLPLYAQLAVALLLGLLVGLQRERASSQVAGIRTFALITLLGAISALVAETLGGWVVAAGALALATLLVVANVAKMRSGESEPGITTEAAALVMYAIGALVVTGPAEMALAAGGIVAVLLHVKTPLHEFVKQIGEGDVNAIMRFALITLVILPLLPDRSLGPYGVLNPFHVWIMVVLIVGIELGGYVAYKLTGARGGTVLAGILGGLISSTATTVGYARRAEARPSAVPAAGAVIGIAATVVFARLVAVTAALVPESLSQIAPPLLVVGGFAAALAALATRRSTRDGAHDLPPQENPTALRPALVFGAVYAVVLVVTAFVRERLGSEALFGVAVVSGVADVDAITLSSLRLASEQRLDAGTAWRLILVAALANLAFKAGIVAVLGPRALFRRVALMFAAVGVAGGLVLALWP